MQWMVRPSVRVVPLEDGVSITIREHLTHGEATDSNALMWVRKDGKADIEPRMVMYATVLAYLVDWTVPDFNGDIIPIRGLSQEDLLSTLRNLTPPAFNAIHEAINAHDRASRERLMELKKTEPVTISA